MITKGEWKVLPHIGNYPIDIKSPEGRLIAVVSRSTYVEAEANANLIAAAPGLYEALRDLTFQFASAVEKPYSKDREVYEKASKALAKAEGKTVKEQ